MHRGILVLVALVITAGIITAGIGTARADTTRLPMIVAPMGTGAVAAPTSVSGPSATSTSVATATPTSTPTNTPASTAILTVPSTPAPTETSWIAPMTTNTPAPTHTPTQTRTATATIPAGDCDPAYPDVCIPPVSKGGDLDCDDIPQFASFRVLPPDPHGFDREGDGIGCEANPGQSSTPAVTPTPSPTATKFVGQITVLGNHQAYTDTIDALHITGEVQNNSGQRAEFVRITANLFNAQNQLVDTDYTYIGLNSLAPGEVTCFDVLFFDGPAYDHYAFETSYSATTDVPLPIAVFGDSGSYNATFDDWYEVVGQARNDSNVNAEFVRVIGTLYHTNGQILDCDYTYTNADVLAPAQVSTWKLTYFHAPAGTVGGYRLQVQGRAE